MCFSVFCEPENGNLFLEVLEYYQSQNTETVAFRGNKKTTISAVAEMVVSASKLIKLCR